MKRMLLIWGPSCIIDAMGGVNILAERMNKDGVSFFLKSELSLFSGLGV